MDIQKIEINKIKPYPNNPRINDKAIEAVANSIKQFGFKQPIVVDQNMTIIAGHTRLKAAKSLNLTHVPILIANDLTPEQIKAYRIADNKTNELASWDNELLSLEIKELEPFNFNILDFGFSEKELNIIKPKTTQDKIPEINQNQFESKPNEIYQLGNHKLLCGDSTNDSLINMLLNDTKIDMIFTDPPYGVSYSDKNEFLNKLDEGNRNQTKIENDDMSLEQIEQLWLDTFSLWQSFLNDYSTYYVCTASSNGLLQLMLNTMEKANMPYKHELIWVKNNHVLGRSDYNYKHEPILYGWNNKHKFYGNGSQLFSTWNFNKPNQSKLHPTMKPVELIENAILNSTQPNMIIADPFLGSGSTLIAAQNTNRICYGAEITPMYCDVIRKRYVYTINGNENDWIKLTPKIN